MFCRGIVFKAAALLVAFAFSGSANAVIYTSAIGEMVDIPGGAPAFADSVLDYSPNIAVVPPEIGNASGQEPAPAFRGAEQALGEPDVTVTSAQTCLNAQLVGTATPDICKFVSLSVGGSLTVEFVDNRLTGSGNSDDDLYIFEVGPDIEDTNVFISMDCVDFTPVGLVTGATKGVDIDAFGFDVGDQFRCVRLTDVAGEGETDGPTVGADIDAIAAISTTIIPVPAAAWLFASGLGLLGWLRRKSTI